MSIRRHIRASGLEPAGMLVPVPANQRPALDTTDNHILQLLQRDGRMTTAELARAISMSASSTADRVRRLTDQGVLQGYRAMVDPVALGYPLTAFVRLRMAAPAGDRKSTRLNS